MTSFNWAFKIHWVSEQHIVLSFKKKDSDEWNEVILTAREYAEFMGLAQEFNINFQDRIQQQIVDSYFNE